MIYHGKKGKKIGFEIFYFNLFWSYIRLRSKISMLCNNEGKQISVEVFAKDTNNFTYALPSTCFLKITLKTSLMVLLYVLEEFAILMRNLESIVQNIKTI